jgi:(1->4)-alpha-D-glucan 1-alpha-D-glucosylmutase
VAVGKWRTLNRRHKSEVDGVLAPDPNEEYLLYQTLVGAWPFESDAETRERFRERIAGYMTKALREAKVHTSWLSPDERYEAAVSRFVAAALDRRRANPFLESFEPFQARVADLGLYNSLAQLLIKITAPGVPDFYQGTELWDLNLVDPDNRRPVDYERRRQVLAELRATTGTHEGLSEIEDLLAHRADGRVKLFATTRALSVRAELREAYDHGEYLPLEIAGTKRDSVFAFARRHEKRLAMTCVPRLIGSLLPDGGAPLGEAVWADTRIALPPDVRNIGPCFRDAFTGAHLELECLDGRMAFSAAKAFSRFPIALLIPAA